MLMAGILDSDNLTIETHDAEDIDSSRNLNITNTMRCGNHVKNCALQNILKIYNGRNIKRNVSSLKINMRCFF